MKLSSVVHRVFSWKSDSVRDYDIGEVFISRDALCPRYCCKVSEVTNLDFSDRKSSPANRTRFDFYRPYKINDFSLEPELG